MALLDLSLVTETLISLVATHINNSDAWSGANVLSVEPLPPDRLEGDNTLGLYLYHVREESQHKNAYVPGVSDTPVRYLPLELHLYYLLTAHSDIEGATSALREQLMMGLAMKALHDFPLINDETRVGGSLVMAPLLRGHQNQFRVSMLPVTNEDAVNYWTAGSSPLRLSAYYQVSVIRLEPEEPMIRAGRVLTYNVFVLPSDNPRVETTENLISFTIPGQTQPTDLELRPAQVTYDQPFSLFGSAFTGDRVHLQIRRADWDEPVTLDASWNVVVTGSRINAVVRTLIGSVTIVPGIYAASVRVERWRPTPSGTRTLESTSNETPFAITPRIDNITAPDVQGNFTVTGAIFQHPDITADAVRVFAGESRLNIAANPPVLQPGEYTITNPATLQARLPGGSASGERLSFRLIIRGAESAPQWITVP